MKASNDSFNPSAGQLERASRDTLASCSLAEGLESKEMTQHGAAILCFLGRGVLLMNLLVPNG